MATQGLEEQRAWPGLPPSETRAAANRGFALRKRLRQAAENAWRQTVTHYMPKPWHPARWRGDKRLSPS
ncbi:hypothetical protein [Methyloceanibacter sp.]|jgi:hypothetical protein|uniref:hypothetical protein n=1 Tax=Methyloceanibacter sp. TaxID=1965321 RepID=UPI00351B9B5C